MIGKIRVVLAISLGLMGSSVVLTATQAAPDSKLTDCNGWQAGLQGKDGTLAGKPEESPGNISQAWLLGKEWLLEDLNGTGVIDNLQSTLKFGNEGQISGFGGCNQYGGDYTLTANQLKIHSIRSTARGCVPAVMNQESRFLGALERATRIYRRGTFLLIETPGTAQLLKFTQLR